jgi:hypothetical protein
MTDGLYREVSVFVLCVRDVALCQKGTLSLIHLLFPVVPKIRAHHSTNPFPFKGLRVGKEGRIDKGIWRPSTPPSPTCFVFETSQVQNPNYSL